MRNSYKEIGDFLRPYLPYFILAFLAMIILALFNGCFTLIIQPVMDELFIQKIGGAANINSYLTEKSRALRDLIQNVFNINDQNMITTLPFLLFLTFLGQSIFSFISLYLMKILGLKVIKDIRDFLFDKLIYQSIGFVKSSSTGDLVSRITNDIDKIKQAVSETLAVMVRESLTIIVLLAVVFYQDPVMATSTLIMAPVVGIILSLFSKKVKKRGIESQETIGRLSAFITERILGLKVVKAFVAEEKEKQIFNKINQEHYYINSRIALAYSCASPIMNVIGGVVAAFIFWLGMKRIAGGYITPGQFNSFLASIFMLYSPLKRLANVNNDLQIGKAAYSRISKFYSSYNLKDDLKRGSKDFSAGDIEFKNINFSYKDNSEKVLKSISFKAKENSVTAIVGRSGAGKTTLLNILLAFYKADSGELLINNQDINSISIEQLRESIGLVSQDIFLFNDTVANNIAYGNPKFSREKIISAAKIARADEFIQSLDKQYDTFIGEDGGLLSTGQRQRISIARAIVREPKILIFDEATSALDSESEKLVQEAMKDIFKGRTVFVIAHRLSTIINADNIIVLDNGEIKEMGNHQQLLKNDSLYSNLYNLQSNNSEFIIE